MISAIQCISFVFILGGSFYFGYSGQPVEMGLAIVAGSIALAFSNIDKIQRFKGAGFEAEMRDKVETMIAKQTEPPKEPPASILKLRAFMTDPDTDKVVKALGSDKYTWRYFGGIAEETQLPKEKINRALEWLGANGLVTEASGKQGTIWGLSPEGREVLAGILADEKNRGA